MAHDAEAGILEQGVVVPADGAAVAAAESLAVPEEPVEPQAQLQELDSFCPVLRSVLLHRVVVRGFQRHDVLLRETFKAVLLILSVHRRKNNEEEGQEQASREHLYFHRLPQPSVSALNGSGDLLLYFNRDRSCLSARSGIPVKNTGRKREHLVNIFRIKALMSVHQNK